MVVLLWPRDQTLLHILSARAEDVPGRGSPCSSWISSTPTQNGSSKNTGRSCRSMYLGANVGDPWFTVFPEEIGRRALEDARLLAGP